MPNKYRFGWIPDYPDFRDYTSGHEKILLLTSRFAHPASSKLPSRVDLSRWCSPVENQLNIGSCTAHAVAAAVEYSEKKAFDKYINASRLFLYKVTRNLMHIQGDSGATLRSSIGALVLFGVPPEEYWPYNTERFDIEPDAFCYAFGQNYRCINYFRHDPADKSPQEVLESVKEYLSAGIPSVFGFTVYTGIRQADKTGRIPFPGSGEKLLGGHAVAAVGYDDGFEITNLQTGKASTGAVLIQNSWGSDWGTDGYGWLPYEYLLKGLACDWWSILKQEWVDTGLFTIPE